MYTLFVLDNQCVIGQPNPEPAYPIDYEYWNPHRNQWEGKAGSSWASVEKTVASFTKVFGEEAPSFTIFRVDG